MKSKFIYFYRMLLFVLAFIGVYLEFKKGGAGMILYYTVLSNLLVLLFVGYLLYLMSRGRDDWRSTKLLRIKGGVAMSILITFVVYHVMLRPIADPSKFWSLDNMLCHYIVPIMFVLDTLLFDERGEYRKSEPFYWTSVPLIYMVVSLFNGIVTRIPVPDAKDSPFPYFFVNVDKYGWGFVAIHCLVIFLAYLAVGYLLFGIKMFGSKKK